jgi:hypothetical protein
MADQNPINSLVSPIAPTPEAVDLANVGQLVNPQQPTPVTVAPLAPQSVMPVEATGLPTVQESLANARLQATPVSAVDPLSQAAKETLSSSAAISQPQVTPEQPNLAINPLTLDKVAEVAPRTVEVASQPSEEQVTGYLDEIFKPVREARAMQGAIERAESERLDEQRKLDKQQEELKSQFSQMDSAVRTRSLNDILSKGSFGEKLLAVFAMGLGAVSQTLTGAKENPVIAFANQMADQQSRRDQLNLDEKKMLQAQLYDNARLKLSEFEQKSNNAYRKEQLKLQQKELADRASQLRMELLDKMRKEANKASVYNGKAMTQEQYANLSPEEKQSVVTLADGRRIMATNKPSQVKFTELNAEVNKGLEAIKLLRDIAKKGSKFSFEDSRRAMTQQSAIVGALRLAFFGPGVMDPAERARLEKIVGNPLSWTSTRPWELAGLDQVEKGLKKSLTASARPYGVFEDIFPEQFYLVTDKATGQKKSMSEDELILQYKSKNPGMNEDIIRRSLAKTFQKL